MTVRYDPDAYASPVALHQCVGNGLQLEFIECAVNAVLRTADELDNPFVNPPRVQGSGGREENLNAAVRSQGGGWLLSWRSGLAARKKTANLFPGILRSKI